MTPLAKTFNLLILISAGSAIFLEQSGLRTGYLLVKPLTTVLIIVLALLAAGPGASRYRWLTLSALVCCLTGDVLLLDSQYFILGLAAFLVAHLLFIFSFVALDRFSWDWRPLAPLLIFGLGYYGYLYPHLQGLAIPVFFYFLFIVVMVWQGVGLYYRTPEWPYRLIAAGAILFLLSDAVLAFNKFVLAFSWSGILVLTTYWLAVALLANASIYLTQRRDNAAA